MRAQPLRASLFLAAATLVLTGCGSQTDDGPSDGGVEVPGTGKNADYAFTGTTLENAPFEGAALKGQPAVVWFWAPWCPTCRAQSPNVARLAERYDGEVAVVGVGSLDEADAIREVADEIPGVTHLVDLEGEIWRHFEVTAQSAYVVIGADGEIKAEGYLDDDELNALVEQLAG